MYFYRKNDCSKCDDCIKNPSDAACNTTCYNPKVNCYESYKVFDPNIYAKAYITLQPYEHLFNLNDALYSGTIFKDLFSPYCEVKYIKEV